MERGFTDGSRIKQDNTPCHTANTVQVRFEGHEEFKVLTWSPDLPDFNMVTHLEDLNVLVPDTTACLQRSSRVHVVRAVLSA